MAPPLKLLDELSSNCSKPVDDDGSGGLMFSTTTSWTGTTIPRLNVDGAKIGSPD